MFNALCMFEIMNTLPFELRIMNNFNIVKKLKNIFRKLNFIIKKKLTCKLSNGKGGVGRNYGISILVKTYYYNVIYKMNRWEQEFPNQTNLVVHL